MRPAPGSCKCQPALPSPPTPGAAAGPPIHHFDLYRLTAPHDLLRLDLPASFTRAVSLVEWADRLGASAPRQHLQVDISIVGEQQQRELERRGLRPPPLDEEEGAWDAAGGGGDARWRRIQLTPHGPTWEARLQVLRSYLAAEGGGYGCWLLPDPDS